MERVDIYCIHEKFKIYNIFSIEGNGIITYFYFFIHS